MVGLAIGAGLLSAAPSIIGGISANKSYKEHAKLLEGMKLDMPGELNIVQEIMRQRMGQDMPGYSQAKTDVMETMPSTLRALKEASSSPSTILASLADIQSGVATNINQLNVQNALSKLNAEQAYTGFLSSVMAPMKMQKQQYENQAKVAGSESRMMGKQQLFQGLTSGVQQGISGGMGMYTGLSMNQAQTELLNQLKTYWGGQ
jgi:hypothetical protein